jgi:hypothetical protein
MRTFERSRRILEIVVVVALLSCATAADTPPANIAGSWTISVTGETGSATQTIVVTQDGNKITGTFKGPRQSGTLDGTVEGNDVKFHVKARVSLDYTGTVNGDTMKGTLSGRGKTGDWTATRSK